jgi:hypothetical protein
MRSRLPVFILIAAILFPPAALGGPVAIGIAVPDGSALIRIQNFEPYFEYLRRQNPELRTEAFAVPERWSVSHSVMDEHRFTETLARSLREGDEITHLIISAHGFTESGLQAKGFIATELHIFRAEDLKAGNIPPYVAAIRKKSARELTVIFESCQVLCYGDNLTKQIDTVMLLAQALGARKTRFLLATSNVHPLYHVENLRDGLADQPAHGNHIQRMRAHFINSFGAGYKSDENQGVLLTVDDGRLMKFEKTRFDVNEFPKVLGCNRLLE